MLSCTSERKPCCGPKSAVAVGEEQIDDVTEAVIDRCGIADEADALAAQFAGFEQAGGAEGHVHVRIML
jgi:hypothetical protein